MLQYLKSKIYLIVNDIYFSVAPVNDFQLQLILLKNKYCQTNSTFLFNPKQKPEVVLGRDKCCDVRMNWGKNFSKFHATFIWDEFLEQWKIIDGGKKGASINGVWIFTTKSFEIHDECILRIENSKVKLKLISAQPVEDDSEGNF